VALVLDDPMLPAAAHLLGAEASDLLGAAVGAAGGQLVDAALVQVQHRPGHDVVARYEASVAWAGAPPRSETLLAACTTAGAPAGTLPLEAEGLEAGVWRYPFDPCLPGLATAVSPGRLGRLIDPLVGPGPRLEVVAYRPIRRAVVRATGIDGRVAYVKVVRTSELAGIVAAHEELRAAGLPVPEVLATDSDAGLLVLAALTGENLRDVLLTRSTGWPSAHQHLDLTAALAVAHVSADAVDGRTQLGDAAQSHARAIEAIVPTTRPMLERIVDAVGHLAAGPDHDQVTVHGDLYEAQLMVQDSRIVGLLDLDDVGHGHPLDDLATTLAHLHILQPTTRQHRDHLTRHRQALRAAFARERDHTNGDELDLRTAAVLVGLATGPFRAQRADWPAEVHRRLRAASRLVGSATRRREKTLRATSLTHHPREGQQGHEVAPALRTPTEGAFSWH